MGFLESVGILAIACVILVLLLNQASSKQNPTVKTDDVRSPKPPKNKPLEIQRKDSTDKLIEEIKYRILEKYGSIPVDVNYRNLIKFSNKCQDEIEKYNNAVMAGRQVSKYNLDKSLKKILKNPLDFWKALEKHLQDKEWKEIREQEELKREELFTKYREVVFGIFDTKTYLSKEEIIISIKNIFRVDQNAAKEMFELWEKYSLIHRVIIDNISSQRKIYEVYFLLSYKNHRSVPGLSREDWLSKHNKSLIENSADYQ